MSIMESMIKKGYEMKKGIVILLVILASCIGYSTASAESTEVTDPNDISVYVDNEFLEFATKPYNESGTVMVPFRPIFEKLGLVVGWDSKTRTVTGTKEGLTIKLQVGSQKAAVNDETKILTVAPKNVNGSVFIPLRFVGEGVQREVVWNSYWKQVVIADTAEQINQVLIMNAILQSVEDEKGLLTIYKKDTYGYNNAVETIIPHEFQDYDLHYSFPEIVSIEDSDEYKIVTVNQQITKSDNSNYLDRTSTFRYAFIKESGSWKIDSFLNTSIKYESTPVYQKKPITLTSEVQKSITDLMDLRIQYANERDIEKLTSIYQEENEGSVDALVNYIQNNDEVESIDDIEFISDGTDEAIVKLTILIDYKDDGFYNSLSEFYMHCKKDSSGRWILSNVELIRDTYLWE
jgi:hypothetical protein